MTGYGAASATLDGTGISVELKTLNSKFLDANIKLPRALADRELEIRTMLTDLLVRGKVSVSLDLETDQDSIQQDYNESLFIKYFEQLKNLADRVGASDDEIFKLALNSPDVIIANQNRAISPEIWVRIKAVISEALMACDQFRLKEGGELKSKFEQYIGTIKTALQHIEKLDPKRVERIKVRISGNISEFIDQEKLDKNRLEQELIYYIEKLDITEEKVRLKSHLDHFTEVLNHTQSSGKKLGFISQEIGREINTIGSKANDADIQKYVVSMKEELEKIKEQLLNVL